MTKPDTDRSPTVRIEINSAGRATRRMVGPKTKRKLSTVVTDLVTPDPSRAARRAEQDAEHIALRRALKTAMKATKVDGSGPTGLTRAKQQPSSLERMITTREIDGAMMQVCQEVEAVMLAISGALVARGFRLEPRSRVTAAPMSERVAFAHSKRFRPWADFLAGRRDADADPSLDIVLSILIDRESCGSCDRRHRIKSGTSKQLFLRALLEYATRAGWAPPDSLDKFDAEHGTVWRKRRAKSLSQ